MSSNHRPPLKTSSYASCLSCLASAARTLSIAFLPLDFVDADGFDPLKATMRQTPRNGVFNRVIDVIPANGKATGHFLPAHSPRPAGEEPFLLVRQPTFTLGPMNPFEYDAAPRAVNASHRVDQHHRNYPQRNKVKSAWSGLGVAAATTFAAARTSWFAVVASPHGQFDDDR